jgi:hypothetical protein
MGSCIRINPAKRRAARGLVLDLLLVVLTLGLVVWYLRCVRDLGAF